MIDPDFVTRYDPGLNETMQETDCGWYVDVQDYWELKNEWILLKNQIDAVKDILNK